VISEVTLHQAWLVLGWVSISRHANDNVNVESRPCPGQPDFPYVGMHNKYWFGHHWGRNGEFCITVSPLTRTAGILI